MIEEASVPTVAALMERIEAGLACIPFNQEDAASIRNVHHAARLVFERELWPYRDNGSAIKACRELWAALLGTMLAFRYCAGLSQQECDWLSQWEPMPGLGAFHFPELAKSEARP